MNRASKRRRVVSVRHDHRKVWTVGAFLLVLGLGGCSFIQQALNEAPWRTTVRVLAYNIKHGQGMDQ